MEQIATHYPWNTAASGSAASLGAFSEDARRGLLLLGGAAFSETETDAAESDGVWVSPPGSPIPEFDISNFAEVVEQPRVVISLADALAASAGAKLDELDAACAAAPAARSSLAPLGLQQAREAVDALIAQADARSRGSACPRCPRCGFDLVPCESSGAICFACASLATPRSRAVCCEQCGVEVCWKCMPGERSEAVPLGPLGDGLPSDLSTGVMGAPAVSEYAGGSPALGEPQAIGAVVADLPLVTSQPAAAHRRRRRRRHCPLCHGGVRGRMVDAEDAALCARCVVDIAAGERAWSCQACSFCLCTHCAPLVDPPLIASQDQAPQGIATDITVAGSTPVGGVDANLRAGLPWFPRLWLSMHILTRTWTHLTLLCWSVSALFLLLSHAHQCCGCRDA